jgi:hypothetical protein
MTGFSEIENELAKLRPVRPSREFSARVERAMADPQRGEDKIIRPSRFRINWVALGFGLAAAAVFVLLARVSTNRTPGQGEKIAENSPATETRSTLSNQFIPAGSTQVVYNTRDEGLHFADGSEEPMRRVRYQTHETLRWHNPNTGASLRVSYPSEEIVLIPVSGQ